MAGFKPGQSGNKAGRPRGIPDRRTQARALFDEHREALVSAAIERALAGDMAALRLCLERVCPPVRATDAPVALGNLPSSLADKGEHVLGLLAAGELAPEAASAVMGAIAQQARIVEISALEQRIAALESVHERS
jgi:hypothetical protein